MPRSTLVTIGVLVLGLLLVIVFRLEIWWAISGLADLIGTLVAAIFRFIWKIIVGLWDLIVGGVKLAWSALIFVFACIAVLLAGVLGIGAVAFLVVALAQQIGGKLSELNEKVGKLNEEARRTGREAAFLALVAALSALIAYMATDDFLRHLTTIRFFAMCCIGLVVAKIFMMLASRVAIFCGIALTVVIFAGAIGFVVARYNLGYDFWQGLNTMSAVLQNPDNRSRLLLFAIIIMLSTIAVLYPFRLGEWKRLLLLDPKASGAPPR